MSLSISVNVRVACVNCHKYQAIFIIKKWPGIQALCQYVSTDKLLKIFLVELCVIIGILIFNHDRDNESEVMILISGLVKNRYTFYIKANKI